MMLNKTMESVDILVIGGGPAGTTAASFLAEKGWRVALLEQDAHPRFHIGESLLPGNLPILERLGVLNAVRDIGEFKPGVDFTCEDGSVQYFSFGRALGGTPDHAFQVKRSQFDLILFDNCKRRGVDARQQHRVVRVATHDDHHVVHYLDEHAKPSCLTARFVIDASGRESFLARKRGWRKRDAQHASAAIFGHFKNVQRRDGAQAGNISVYWFDQGWVWMIPLRDDVMSIGAVCWPAFLRARETALESFLLQLLAAVPGADERTLDAVAIGPVRATGNYSYRSSKLYADGYLMVGDAYAFIDPVFSSGVYLAMNSAIECLPAVEAWLNSDRKRYRQACRKYQRVVDGKIAAFSWFIYRFTTPTLRDLFRNPRNDWQVEQAVVSMLAGDGDGSPGIRWRLQIFKVIYRLSWLKHGTESLRAWWRRRREVRVSFSDT